MPRAAVSDEQQRLLSERRRESLNERRSYGHGRHGTVVRAVMLRSTHAVLAAVFTDADGRTVPNSDVRLS